MIFSLHTLLTFSAAAFAIIIIPGPSVLFVVSRGVVLGRRAAVATVAGNGLGVLVQVVAVAAGLGAVVERSAAVFNAVKVCGALYLVYMGVQMIRHRQVLAGVLETAVEPKSVRRIIGEGFVVGITNPKIIVFFGAVLPQFVERSRGRVPLQMLVLGLVFVVIAFLSDSAWGLAAGTARHWFASSPKRLAHLGGLGGLAIVGLGVRLAFSGRDD